MPTIEEINSKNLARFMEDILAIEKQYPEDIRTSEEDYRELFEIPGSFGMIALDGDTALGTAIGYPLDEEETEEFLLPQGAHVCYLQNIAVNPSEQGKGYGKLLINAFIGHAEKKGFDVLAGHYRPNASLALIRKAGGTVVRIEKNWEGTGEDYAFCTLDLGSGTPGPKD